MKLYIILIVMSTFAGMLIIGSVKKAVDRLKEVRNAQIEKVSNWGRY